MLAAVPGRYGTVGGFLRTFGPPADGGDGSFAERMTVRFSALAPINDPASLFKPIRKIVHRAHPEIQVTRGNHALVDSPFAPLRGWYPIEVFHFPLRSHEQCERKARLQGTAFEKYVARPPTAYHANMFAALKSGKIAEYYDSLVLAEDELERGIEQGRLVVDTRLRDALRLLQRSGADGGLGEQYVLPSEATPLSFPVPSLVEDAEYAVESAVLGEADVVRLQRRLDTLERRLLTLELRLPDPRLPEALRARPSARSGATHLDRPNPHDHLVQPVAGLELLRPQVGRGQAVEKPCRREHVPVRGDLDVAGAEGLLRQAVWPSGTCSATTRPTPRPRAARSS